MIDLERAEDVHRFWRRLAPAYYLPAEDPIEVAAVSCTDRHCVYRVTTGAVRAVVRWTPGSLLRVDPAAVQHARLFIAAAEAGLAPRVLMWDRGALELDGQPVIVTDDAGGSVADPAWFRDNIQQAAVLLARLHRDEALGDMLEHLERGDRRADALAAARSAWAALQARLDALESADLPPEAAAVLPDLRGYVQWFGPQIQVNLAAFRGQRVAPVHGDLNDGNWLITPDNRAYLLDWERARWDDPALDVGMLLHWYVPARLWAAFAQAYTRATPHRVDPDALLARAGVRYALHAVAACVWQVEQAAAGRIPPDQVGAFAAPFLADLRQLRAGVFGTQ
jgi:aminoglycoside phosphotransferase (APT) family kinase protein